MKLDDLERLSEFEDVCVAELPRLLAIIRQMKEALEYFTGSYILYPETHSVSTSEYVLDGCRQALKSLATYEEENHD